MTIKWSKKIAAEYAEQLKSPLDEILAGQTTQEGKSVLPNLAEKIKELVTRNKGVKT